VVFVGFDCRYEWVSQPKNDWMAPTVVPPCSWCRSAADRNIQWGSEAELLAVATGICLHNRIAHLNGSAYMPRSTPGAMQPRFIRFFVWPQRDPLRLQLAVWLQLQFGLTQQRIATGCDCPMLNCLCALAESFLNSAQLQFFSFLFCFPFRLGR